MKTPFEMVTKKFDTPSTGCWEWKGSMGVYGYGTWKYKKKNYRAHRIVYELVVGKIPEGLVLDHLCKNKKCVNPEHLEPVTQKVNVQRSDAGKLLDGMCKSKRHPRTSENTYTYPWSGWSICLPCHKLAAAKRRDKIRKKENKHEAKLETSIS